MIGIIDYEMGNLGSVTNACDFLEMDARVITRPEEMDACRAVILPGVGAFGDCMEHLDRHGFSDAVRAWVASDRPFLGICVGFQALFEGSEESPGVPGLGIFPGTVRKFASAPGLKVPQIGWNRVRTKQEQSFLFEGIPDGTHFYFVHSYYVDPADKSIVAGSTEYGIEYASAMQKGNALAVQFHPEKSQKYGLKLLSNYGSWIERQAATTP